MLMNSNKEKYENYKILFSRLNKALKNEFYLEAIFIEYALIEDRLKSILISANRFKPNLMSLSRKMSEVKRYHQLKTSSLSHCLTLEILDLIKLWSLKRNQLIHALAANNFDDDTIKEIATEGIELVRQISKSAQKFKSKIENL